MILLSSCTQNITVQLNKRNETVGQPGACQADQFRQEKEHHNQLVAILQDSPFPHLGAPVLTNAGGLAL